MIVIPWNDLPAVRCKGDQIKWINLQNGAYCQPKAHVDAAHGPLTVLDPLVLPDVHPREGGHLLLGEALLLSRISQDLCFLCLSAIHTTFT